jgi:hypothetical protein
MALTLFADASGAPWRSSAELVRVEGVEFPESELTLNRRATMGMRDCASRRYEWTVVGESGATGPCGSGGADPAGGDDGSAAGFRIDGEGGRGRTPAKSLCVRRCIWGGRLGMTFSVLISSRVGVTPRYQAEGDDGETRRGGASSGNIGLGLCMLPSDPRRRRGPGMP